MAGTRQPRQNAQRRDRRNECVDNRRAVLRPCLYINAVALCLTHALRAPALIHAYKLLRASKVPYRSLPHAAVTSVSVLRRK
eukprot:6178304-Pleurochrysis_carterae.AAC.3